MGNPDVGSDCILRINSIFYTVQGEGHHGGTPAVFIRLSDCNLSCSFCDTEFKYGEPRSCRWILGEVERVGGPCKFIVLTGGEPGMQNIGPLVDLLKKSSFYVAIETNGMYELPSSLDWVCVSPKTNIKSDRFVVRKADEYKFVVGLYGKVPNTSGLSASHYWLSPKNNSSMGGETKVGEKSCSGLDSIAAKYCVQMAKENLKFKLSLQTHKYIGVE